MGDGIRIMTVLAVHPHLHSVTQSTLAAVKIARRELRMSKLPPLDELCVDRKEGRKQGQTKTHHPCLIVSHSRHSRHSCVMTYERCPKSNAPHFARSSVEAPPRYCPLCLSAHPETRAAPLPPPSSNLASSGRADGRNRSLSSSSTGGFHEVCPCLGGMKKFQYCR